MIPNCFAVVLICLGFPTFAQTPWNNYNTTDGLIGNSVICATSDKYDNIWVGVGSGSNGLGLERFNGFRWIHLDSSNSDLPENDIKRLASDSLGNLWLCYYGGLGPNLTGLTKYDGVTWTVFDTSNSDILSNIISDLIIDKDNNLWISTWLGISKFDGNNFTNYLFPECGRIAIDDSGNVWMANIYGLHHLNPVTGSWTSYNTSNSSIPSNNTSCIDIDSSGLIWLGFNFGFPFAVGGLATFNGNSFTAIWPFQNVGTGVYDLKVDHTNNVWVSTRCEGLYRFDGFAWSKELSVPLQGCSFEVMVDNDNYIWFGEVTTGIWTNRPDDSWGTIFLPSVFLTLLLVHLLSRMNFRISINLKCTMCWVNQY